MEALHLHQHAEEPRVGRVGRLGEDPAESLGPGVLEPAAVAAHRHAHVGRLGLHAELAEEAQQGGVRAQVVHDEPAVDRHDAAVGRDDVVGVGVPTEAGLGFVEGDVALALQHVRGGEPGHAGPDDRDAPTPLCGGGVHGATSPVTSRHPRGACELERAFERRVVDDGGGERGREPVPGGSARQHAVTAPRHVQAHRASGDRHRARDEPCRRPRARRAVARAVQHHEIATGELLDRFGARQPRRQRDHAPHRRMTGRTQRGPSTHRVPDEDDGHAVVARIERGEGEGDVGEGVVAGVVPAPDPVAELCDREVVTERGEVAGEGLHAANRQLARLDGCSALGLAAVQDEDRSPRRRVTLGDLEVRLGHGPVTRLLVLCRQDHVAAPRPHVPWSDDLGIGASFGCTPGVRRGTATGWPARADSRLPRLNSAGAPKCRVPTPVARDGPDRVRTHRARSGRAVGRPRRGGGHAPHEPTPTQHPLRARRRPRPGRAPCPPARARAGRDRRAPPSTSTW